MVYTANDIFCNSTTKAGGREKERKDPQKCYDPLTQFAGRESNVKSKPMDETFAK